MAPPRRFVDGLAAALFAAALVAPTVDLGLRPEVAESARAEWRRPAPWPAWPGRFSELTGVPQRVTSAFDDRLGLRDRLLGARAAMYLFGLGLSPTPRLIVGADRWLFLDELGIPHNHRGDTPLTGGELRAWQRALEGRQRFVAGWGGRLVLAIVPEKNAVYPERLPEAWRPIGPSRTDQFLAWMRANSTLEPIDLRPDLLAARAQDGPDDFVSYPFGTHWSTRGAVAGARGIARRLARDLPGGEALAAAFGHEAGFVPGFGLGDNWAPRLHLSGALVALDFGLVETSRAWHGEVVPRETTGDLVTVNDDARLPTAFVVHDSFGEPLRWLLPRCFSRATFVWWDGFPAERIAAEEPDVVLLVYGERLLGRAPWPLVPGSADLEPEFERARPLGARLGAAELARHVLLRGEVEVAPAQDGVDVRQLDATGLVLLPELGAAGGAPLLLAVELTAPEAGTLSVLYATRAEPEFVRRRMLQVAVPAGRSTALVEVVDPEQSGRIALQLSRPPKATWTLHAVEGRVR